MANLFPKATNLVVIKTGFVLSIVGGLVTLAVWYYFTPKYSRVGYQPTQPVYFQHDIHVGQLRARLPLLSQPRRGERLFRIIRRRRPA